MSEKIADMGQFVSGNSTDILGALGLGSCIALVIYDPYRKIAVLSHIMLPTAKDAPLELSDARRFKYADVIIPYMYDLLIAQGSRPEHLLAKMAGGAHMFKGLIDLELLDIGKHNAQEARRQLEQFRIKLVAEDAGGIEGRSVHFHVADAKCIIKSKSGIKEI